MSKCVSVLCGVAALVVVASSASGQGTEVARFGARCSSGQFGYESALMVCSDGGTFRYAVHEDIPPAPEGGYTAKPAWYPPLSLLLARADQSCPLTGRVTFTNPVINPDDLISTIPQGMMIGDHVTPIDHGYLGVRTLAIPQAQRTDADWLPVYAPADGTITEVSLLGSPTSIRVVIAHGCETYSIYMVLNRVAGALASLHDELMSRQYLRTSIQVRAGELFGEQRDNPLDFSVHDGATWLSGYIAPFSYLSSEGWKPFTVDPWPYFAPDLAAAYEAKMQRVAAPRWGRIDVDVAGTAAGNWFLSGTLGYSGRSVDEFRNATSTIEGGGFVPGKNFYAWSHLSLAPHWVQPAFWIFSTGWYADPAGDPKQRMLVLRSGVPAPSELTPASGTVVYALTDWMSAGQTEGMTPLPVGYEVSYGQGRSQGLVALRVNEDGTLTVEVFPTLTDPAQFTGFTPEFRTYRR